MNKNEENKYSMYKAVDSTLDDNKEGVQKIEALVEAQNDFKNILENISKKDNDYKTVSKGATNNKRQAENLLVEGINAITSGMYVYASKINDQNLMALCDMTTSDFTSLRDTELLQTSKKINEKVQEVQADLVKYGIGEVLVTQLDERVNNHETALSAQDSKGDTGVASRKELTELFQQTDKMLYKELDNLMEIVKLTNPGFYNKYQSARVIIDL